MKHTLKQFVRYGYMTQRHDAMKRLCDAEDIHRLSDYMPPAPICYPNKMSVIKKVARIIKKEIHGLLHI